MNELGAAQLSATRAFLASRQDEILGSICKLVETESPSGDFEGSSAVVDLLVDIVRTIPEISSIERILVPGYGEHLRMRAFDGQVDDTRTTLVLGHTDTVHPRGTFTTQSVRAEAGRLYGPGIFDMKGSCVLALEALRTLATLDFVWSERECLGSTPGWISQEKTRGSQLFSSYVSRKRILTFQLSTLSSKTAG